MNISIYDKEYNIYILAGGMGKRMKSDLPKVCVDFLGKPMLIHLINECLKTKAKNIFLVVGKYKSVIENILNKYNLLNHIKLVIQENSNGTGHAVMSGIQYINKLNNNSNLVILYGDTPLTSSKLIHKLGITNYNTILALNTNDNFGLGRIITDNNNEFIDIVEEKDANIEQKKITLVNTGLYSFIVKDIISNINKINNNNKQNEYYLTDLPKLIKNKNKIDIIKIPEINSLEVTGINTPEQLKKLKNKYIINNIIINEINDNDYNKDLYKLFNILSPTKEFTRQDFNNYLKRISNTNQKILVVKYNKNIIATISYYIEEKILRNFSKVCHIEDVITDNKYSGCGIGKFMLDHVKLISKNNNCYKIVLNCNKKLSKYYMKHNFEINGIEMKIIDF